MKVLKASICVALAALAPSLPLGASPKGLRDSPASGFWRQG
jgi:hypothetical protein